MSKTTTDPLPKNATEAQGLLIKAFHEKCGDDILPILDDILGRQGRALGLKLKAGSPTAAYRPSPRPLRKASTRKRSTLSLAPIKSSIFREPLAHSDWKHVAAALRSGDGHRPRILFGGDGRQNNP